MAFPKAEPELGAEVHVGGMKGELGGERREEEEERKEGVKRRGKKDDA